jgi:AcrR family transcriptional regulator
VAKSVSKLIPKVPPLPGVPGTSRRQQYSASTKRALLEVAEKLFAEQGYAGTSLDAIVAGAQVTKGALYHHFSGKQALYEAVFERVESDSARRIQQLTQGIKDPWEKAQTGLRGFLDIVRDPIYRRIVILDGPAVLGYERYREQEERSAFGVVEEIVRTLLTANGAAIADEMVETFARIFFGALSSAGEAVAASADPEAGTLRVEAALTFILTGIQSLADQGLHIGTPGTD